MRDIIAHLGSKDFYRLRIGIGRPASGCDVADYVLSRPSLAGAGQLREAFLLVENYMDGIVEGDVVSVANKMHI